ncbi:hypothetical protein J4558_04005 [Leptolyngbya sp. 15MV]|nr:hypothetical protein J4558_04005 [Leptolyngbya sp. 15MV]
MRWRDLFRKTLPQNPILTGGTQAAPTELFGEVDQAGVFHCPRFIDPISGQSAESGQVRVWHLPPGRSMVSGQRICDVETSIGVVPIRTRVNAYLIEILTPVGASVTPGQPMWRCTTARQVF